MASNADILKKYGLTESGKKQTATVPSASPVSASSPGNAAILAKYGLAPSGTTQSATTKSYAYDRQEESAERAQAAHEHSKALATERADEQDKLLVPSASRQQANALSEAKSKVQSQVQEKTPWFLPTESKGKDQPLYGWAMTDRQSDAVKKINSDATRTAATIAGIGSTLADLGKSLEYSASSDRRIIENAKKSIETYTTKRDAATTEADRAYWQGLIDYAQNQIAVRTEGFEQTHTGLTEASQAAKETQERLLARASEGDRDVRARDALRAAEKYADDTFDDGFAGRFGANYDVGRLSQDSSYAWNEYINNPTEENRAIAELYDAALENVSQNNSEALSGKGLISKTVAGYLPQLLDQTKARVRGGVAGAAAGSVVPVIGTVTGAKQGAAIASAADMYAVTRGAAFKGLIDAGATEQEAMRMVKDEAFLSSLIEYADTLVDFATLGFEGAIKSLLKDGAKTATTEAGKKAGATVLKKIAAYVGNVAGEYAEEAAQEGVSIANETRAQQGTTDSGKSGLAKDTVNTLWNDYLLGQNEESRQRIHEAGVEGAKIAAMFGGGEALMNYGIQSAAERTSRNAATSEVEAPRYLQTAEQMIAEREAQNAGKATQATTAEGSLTAPATEAAEAQKTAAQARSYYDDLTAATIRREGKTFRNLVAGIDTSISDFINKWRNGRNASNGDKLEKLYLAEMPEDVRARVSDILGYEVNDRDFILTNENVKHEWDEHGDADAEIRKGNLPLEPWVFEALPEVLTSPDKIEPGHMDKRGDRLGVKFSKVMPNGRVVTIQFDNSGRGTMETRTFYAKENGDTISVSHPSSEEKSPTVRPKRPESVSPVSDVTLSQPSNVVKPRSEYEEMLIPTAKQKYGFEPGGRPISGDASTEGYMDALVNSEPKPEKRNRPSRSKSHLRSDLISTFSIPEGSRATFANRIDAIAEEMLTNGRISDEHRAELIRALYDAGVSVQEADPAYKAARDALKGRKIFVNESIRSELGDDWNDLRRRAMANGFYLTADPNNGLGVDVVADELSSVLGNSIINSDADGATQLRQMVDAAQLGRNETISLADEADLLAQQYGEGVREDQISNLERQFDDAMRRFAEKARLEVDLKDRTDERVAREKEVWREAFRKRDDAKKQRDAAKQTLNNLKRLRKRIGQNDTRLAEALGQLSPEEQKLAQEALGNLSTDAQRLTEKAKAKMAENAARYEQLVANDPNYIPDKKTLALLERMDQKYLADMSTEELMSLHRALQTLEKHLSDMNKEIGRKRGEEFAVLYRDAKYNVEGSKGRKNSGTVVSRALNEEQLTPMNYLEMLGGWDPENTWNKTVTRQLEEGERARKQFVVEANQMLKDWREKHADWIAKSDGQGKNAKWYDIEVPKLFAYDEMDHSPIFNGTETVHLTPAMRVELARGIRNSDNLRHAEGGVTFPDKELYSKGQRKEAYARGTTVKLAPETMKALFSYDNLTAEEKELFNLMDTFFDEKAKDAINETSQQIDGVDRAMSNHYSKIYTNSNYRTTDATKIDESLGGMPSLQKRVFSRNPMLAMSVWEAFDDTVDTVSKYHGLAIPVRNVDMLFNWTEQDGGNSMKNVLSQKWGGDSVKYIEDLLRNLQNRQYSEKSGVDALAGKALNNYVTATFGANPGIVLKQFSSFPSAAAVLGVDTIPSPAQIAKTDPKLIAKYTPELEYRSMGYATPELAELKNNPNWTQRNKITRFLFGGAIQGMDRFTVKAMWPWAENYVKKNFTDLKPGTDAFYQKTAEVFNDAVSQTQPMYDVMHRAKIMQNPSDLTRAFTMFKTVPMQQQNMLRKALGEAQSATGSAKKAANRNLARTIGSIVMANLLFETIELGNQAWKNAAKNYRDDDDELTAASAGSTIAENTLKDMAGMFLGGDELTDIVDIIGGKKSSYMSGLETPGLSQIQDIITSLETAGKGVRKVAADTADIVKNGGSVKEYVEANGGDFLGDIKDLAESMSVYFAGVPVTNIEKYLLGALRAVSPEVEQEYKAFFDTTTKRDLSGLSGEALQVRVDDLIDNRVQNVSAESKQELARLYESTGVEVIPTDVPSYVTVDGERQDLTASEQQAYRTAYSSALDGELDKMLASPEYKSLPDDQKAAAITSLYSYAKDTAKREAVSSDLTATTKSMNVAKSMGLDPATYCTLKAQIGELDGDEKAADKLKLIRDADLTPAERSAAYYAFSANDKEKKLVDRAPHLSVGAMADALIGVKLGNMEEGAEKTRVTRQTLIDSPLPESEKRGIYKTLISDSHEKDIDNMERAGVSFDDYLKFERDVAGVSSTKDANGKDVKGQTRRDKVLAIIDGYRISRAQKDAMYYAAGYAESTLKNAPWYGRL